MSRVITTYSQITAQGVINNGRILLQDNGTDPGSFFKEIYKSFDIGYPKFYKMDNLSKLCFLATENLLRGVDKFHEYPQDKIAVVVQNRSSSLDTDQKHQESIADRNNYFPSPAVFVYTLPNIMLGEICIRHKIKGENSCFLAAEFDAGFIEEYVNILFTQDDISCCITGWIDYYEGDFRANLFLVEKETSVDTYITKFGKDSLELMIKNNGRID